MNFYDKLESIQDNLESVHNEDVRNDVLWMVKTLRQFKEALGSDSEDFLKLKEENEKLKDSYDNLIKLLLMEDETNN